MSVFRLTMLPAREGDCLLLDYGETEDSLRHVLIDGGRKSTWDDIKLALESIAARGEEIDLMVLSHIDADHLDGLIEMAEEGSPLVPKALWYNGFRELERLVDIGGIQPLGFLGADKYSELLDELGWSVNEEFNGNPLMIETRPEPFEFAGLTFTLVSPDRDKLNDLKRKWDKWREAQDDGAAGLGTADALGALQPFRKRPMPETLDVEELSGPGGDDGSEANGSSIAMIVEFDGKRVFLAADAHSDLLEAAIDADLERDGDAGFELFKLSHHGSRANITKEMLEKLKCHRFAVSTSGARFGHPDPECIARILKFGAEGAKTLYFNYASERTTPWDDADLKATWSYDCVLPEGEADGTLVIDI